MATLLIYDTFITFYTSSSERTTDVPRNTYALIESYHVPDLNSRDGVKVCYSYGAFMKASNNHLLLHYLNFKSHNTINVIDHRTSI
jgi:hypothetical protein